MKQLAMLIAVLKKIDDDDVRCDLASQKYCRSIRTEKHSSDNENCDECIFGENYSKEQLNETEQVLKTLGLLNG